MANIVARLDELELDNFDYRPFVPFNRLQELFTHETILEILQDHGLEFYVMNEVVDRVLEGGLRTFATLAAIGNIGSIMRFIKQDQFSGIPLDAKLPLKDADISQYFSDTRECTQFLRKQWTFLAPVFSGYRSHRELHERTILPFLRKDFIGEGGFAKVYKVKVHASHHSLSSTPTEVSLLTMLGSIER